MKISANCFFSLPRKVTIQAPESMIFFSVIFLVERFCLSTIGAETCVGFFLSRTSLAHLTLAERSQVIEGVDAQVMPIAPGDPEAISSNRLNLFRLNV